MCPYRHDRANAFIFATAVLTPRRNMVFCKQIAESGNNGWPLQHVNPLKYINMIYEVK
jgi:hypothetical protein